MGTRAMISDLKSESHLHLATIERHDHHIKIVSTKAYIHDKLVHSCIINHFHSLLMRACNNCWVGGVADTPHTIYSLVIILAVNGLDTVFYGVNLVKIHLFGLTFPLRTQTKPN